MQKSLQHHNMPKEIRVTVTDPCASCSISCDTVPYQLLSPYSVVMSWHDINQEPDCVGGSLLHRHTASCILFTFPKPQSVGACRALSSPPLRNIVSELLSPQETHRTRSKAEATYSTFVPFVHCMSDAFSVHAGVAQCPRWLSLYCWLHVVTHHCDVPTCDRRVADMQCRLWWKLVR